jgi:8-oxo-dGTP diphosphatase
MFFENHQLISIYYEIGIKGDVLFPISEKLFDFPADTEGSQSFRWQKLNNLKADDLSFPVDRFVAEMLTRQYKDGKI